MSEPTTREQRARAMLDTATRRLDTATDAERRARIAVDLARDEYHEARDLYHQTIMDGPEPAHAAPARPASAHADCPACSARLTTAYPATNAAGETLALFQTCTACNALAVTLTERAPHDLPLLPAGWHTGPSRPEEERYYDIVTVNAAGARIARRHGWYNTRTGRITQTG